MSNARRISIIFLLFNILSIGKVFASEPKDIRISNLGSSKFTISWTTDVPEIAQINYGATTSLGSIAYDTRGNSFEGTTHYVTINNLSANTAYCYDIVCGGATYDNGGAHFNVTTPVFLSPQSGSDIAYGQVYLNGGAAFAEGSIVYIKLQDNNGQGTSGNSQLCSSLVGNTGYWSLQLKNVRNQALNSYFVYSTAGDNLALDAIGPDGGAASETVNTSNDTPAASMTLSPAYWTLNMTEMNWYENTAPYNSTGAASCQMILNYIRQGAAQPLITQDEIYQYARDPNSYGPELTPDEVDKVLGHFDPYDYLVSNWSDSYDSFLDGNPYQGYNYTIDTYDPDLDVDAINKYMRDICHWMAFTATKEDWWADGELVARPNTPAAIPIYGSYANWVAVKGCVTSENPCPEPRADPWNTPDFTVYGFWIKDPRVSGIGQNTYKTAAECQSTYFLPLATGDAYDGLFLQVAEPPARVSEAIVEISKPNVDLANLDFIGVESVTKDSDETSPLMEMSLSVNSKNINRPIIKKQSWKDLVDRHLLADSEAVSAFENTEIGKAVFVYRTDGGADYYLVPFNKRVKKGKFLTSAVMVLDAKDGYFKETSWTNNPEAFLVVGRAGAMRIIERYLLQKRSEELKDVPKKPVIKYAQKINEIVRKYSALLRNIRYAETDLIWEPGKYSTSPYKPYWRVDVDGNVWYVTQDGAILD